MSLVLVAACERAALICSDGRVTRPNQSGEGSPEIVAENVPKFIDLGTRGVIGATGRQDICDAVQRQAAAILRQNPTISADEFIARMGRAAAHLYDVYPDKSPARSVSVFLVTPDVTAHIVRIASWTSDTAFEHFEPPVSPWRLFAFGTPGVVPDSVAAMRNAIQANNDDIDVATLGAILRDVIAGAARVDAGINSNVFFRLVELPPQP